MQIIVQESQQHDFSLNWSSSAASSSLAEIEPHKTKTKNLNVENSDQTHQGPDGIYPFEE